MAQSLSLIGGKISHYRISAKLGAGGMGVVYRAHDEQLDRDVALKVLPVNLLNDEKARARLRREAQTAAALNHSNICVVYEVSEFDGLLFIAMELVNGRTLKDLAAGGLPKDVWLKYAIQISDALAHAHNLGILHRDIKASNVMVSESGRAKVLDFGLARHAPADDIEMTRSNFTLDKPGSLVGTLCYAAPEVLQGKSPDARSDVWSLGVMLFETATGKLPFGGRTTYELTSAILQSAPQRITSTEYYGLSDIILRCLSKSPEERYQQAGEVLAALEAASIGQWPKPIKPNPLFGAFHTGINKMWTLTLAVILVIAALLMVRKYVDGSEAPKEGQLAVLPVNAAESDATTTAFGKGLVQTLTTRLTELSQSRAVKIIPASAIQLKNVTTAEQARKEFGANLGLELNLQRSGDQIRINFNVIDAASMRQIGGGTVTGKASDSFDVEDKVCEGVAKALEIQLKPIEKQALMADRTAQPRAYDYYLQGRGYIQNFNRPESFDSAVSVFNHALELDPNYGPAYAGLGQAYWKQFVVTKDEKLIKRAEVACRRALELQNGRSDGHVCLGSVLEATGQYERAEQEFQEAVRLEPGDDDSYIGLASSYEKLGQTTEAEETYRRAIALRPNYPLGYNRLGELQIRHAQYQDAAEMFKQVIALSPDNFAGYSNLGDTYILQDRYSEAIPLLERSITIRKTAVTLSNLATAYFQMRRFKEAADTYGEAVTLDDHNYEVWGNLADAYYWAPGLRSKAPPAYEKAISLAMHSLDINPRDVSALGYLAEYHAMLGRRKQAMAYLARCLALEPKDPDLLVNAALIYNQVGDSDKAIYWLRKAVLAGSSKTSLRNSPNFDNLRDNSEFIKFTKQ